MVSRYLSYSIIQNNITLAIKTGILLAATILIYLQDLSIVFGNAVTLSAGNITNYVLVIPFLIAYVLYRKRKILRVTASLQERQRSIVHLDEVIGITLCLIAIIMYVYGSSTLYSLEYHIFSLPIFVAGSTMLLFNIKTFRHAIFAIVLLAYLQPPPGEFVSEFAADLSWGSAVMVQGMLNTFGMPITLEATYGAPALLIEKPDGTKIPFFVGEPSSGVYSTVGLSLFALFVAYIIRGAIWKRAVIFVAGFPIFFLLNMLRIATIISLWYTFGEGAAESFHIVSGSVMVAIGTIIILLFGEKILRVNIRTQRIQREQCPACQKSLAMGESLCLFCGRLLKQLTQNFNTRSVSRMGILILIASMVTVSQMPTETASAETSLSNLDISSIEGSETTQYFLPQVEGWDLKYAYRDLRVEKVLRQDAALAFMYIAKDSNSNTTTAKPTIFSGIQISTGRHTWEASLLLYPSKFGRPTATVIELKDVDIAKDQKAKLFIYQRPGSNLTEAVLYWFEKVQLRFGSQFEARNVQILLWAYTDTLARYGLIEGVNDTEGIEALFLSLAKPISSYWDQASLQLKRITATDALVNQQPYALMSAIIIPALLILARYHNRTMLLQRANKKAFEQLTLSDEKLVITTIVDPARQNKPTGESIANAYRKLTGKSITENNLVEMLELARNIGLIKKEISCHADEPLLVWKPNFEAGQAGVRTLFGRLKRYVRKLTRS